MKISTIARNAALSSRESSTVSSWIDSLTSSPAIIRTDTVDSLRTGHLQRTLPTRIGPNALGLSPAGPGDPLPYAHHLVLFQPQTPLDQLGLDGSSTEYNPPAPYLRRMWAGGSFHFNPSHPLKIGSEVTEMTRVPKVEFKKDMIFVHQEKKYFHGTGKERAVEWAIKELRTHMFRTDEGVKTAKGVSVKPVTESKQPLEETIPIHLTESTSTQGSKVDKTFIYTPTSPLLFRYSALTYNGHKIHYDKEWTQQVEGHPDLVVHGPLTATFLVELAAFMAVERGRNLRRLEYRATCPMYVDREVILQATKSAGQDGSGTNGLGGSGTNGLGGSGTDGLHQVGSTDELGVDGNAGLEEEVIEMKAEQGGRVGMLAKAILA